MIRIEPIDSKLLERIQNNTEVVVCPLNYYSENKEDYLRKQGIMDNFYKYYFGKIDVDDLEKFSEAFKNNTSVRFLKFGGELLEDKHIKVLAKALKHGRVEVVDLQSNNIGDEGAIYLAEMLKTNKTIKTITLYGNKICDAGGEALARSFARNQTLQQIYLGGNEMNPDTRKKIYETLDDVPHVFEVTKITDYDEDEINIDSHIWDVGIVIWTLERIKSRKGLSNRMIQDIVSARHLRKVKRMIY